MKYVREVLIVIAFTFIGEVLNAVLPLPVPSGVYGLFLLLAALMTGLIHLDDVETTGNFLLDTMTMMFIPAAVAIMNCVDVLMPVLVPYLLIIVISTVLVMSVTGLTAQSILRRTETASSEAAEDAEPIVQMTTGIGVQATVSGGADAAASGKSTKAKTADTASNKAHKQTKTHQAGQHEEAAV